MYSAPTIPGPRGELMSAYRQEVIDELRRLEEDLLYTEKGHFMAANELSRLHLGLGIAATLAAAASVATIVGEASAVLSGTLALIASLASAVLTFVKPDQKVGQHLAAGRLLNDVRVRSRQCRALDLHADSGLSRAEWRSKADEIRSAKAEVDQTAPSISDRRFAKAQEKIRSGDFTHDSVHKD